MNNHAKKSKKTQILTKLNPQVAGIDVGSKSCYVCIGLADGTQKVREFPNFTADLNAMVAWFKANGIKSVAMESTGSFWIPIYEIIDQAGIEVNVVNAHHLKTVPGRKTDVKDCQWIQHLHACGLLSGSFRPTDECVKLRSHVRQRSRTIESASTQVLLMHKTLIQMNVRINLVLRDIKGATGMKIMRAIISGIYDPKVLAQFRDPHCKKSVTEIEKALEGNYRPEHVFALAQAVKAYEFFHTQAQESEHEIEKILISWAEAETSPVNEKRGSAQSPSKKRKNSTKIATRKGAYSFDPAAYCRIILGVDLTEIPGIDGSTLMKILSETGTDMSKFRSGKQFASWLGLCPGNKISGGKVLNSKTKPSANRAAAALRMSANTLDRSQTALGAFYRRMKARMGAPKAITATAHKMALIIYSMIKYRKSYIDLGADVYERAYRDRCVANLKKRAIALGFTLIEEQGQAAII